jgi:hypothetical protein
MDSPNRLGAASEISKLTNQLVSSFLYKHGNSSESNEEEQHRIEAKKERLLQYCMRIYDSRLSPSIIKSDFSISQIIQKKRNFT